MKIIRHTVGGPRYAKKEIAEGPVYSCGLTFPGIPVGKPVDVHVSLQTARPDQKMGSHQYEVLFTTEEEARLALSILTEFLQRRGVDMRQSSATFLLQAPIDGNHNQRKVATMTHEQRCDAIITAAEEIIELARLTRQQSHHTKDHAGLISGYLTNIEQLINPWEES